jgi:hypothetical protein
VLLHTALDHRAEDWASEMDEGSLAQGDREVCLDQDRVHLRREALHDVVGRQDGKENDGLANFL